METNENLAQTFQAQRSLYDRYRQMLHQMISDFVESKGTELFSIESRTKTVTSFREKLQRNDKIYSDPLSQITDLVGIRLICYFSEDVDNVCQLIRNFFFVDEKNSVDKRPKYNELDYRSRHIIISLGEERRNLDEYRPFRDLKAEVQVRTISEHTWAAIEHKYNYKNTKALEDSIRRRLYRLQAVLEMCDDEFSRFRLDVERGRQRLREKVNADKAIKINAETLRTYIDSKSSNYEILMKNLRERSFKFKKRINTEYSTFVSAADRLRYFNIETIDQCEAAIATCSEEPTLTHIETSLLASREARSEIVLQTDVIHLVAALAGINPSE